MTYVSIACQIFVKFTAGDIVNVVVRKVDIKYVKYSSNANIVNVNASTKYKS